MPPSPPRGPRPIWCPPRPLAPPQPLSLQGPPPLWLPPMESLPDPVTSTNLMRTLRRVPPLHDKRPLSGHHRLLPFLSLHCPSHHSAAPRARDAHRAPPQPPSRPSVFALHSDQRTVDGHPSSFPPKLSSRVPTKPCPPTPTRAPPACPPPTRPKPRQLLSAWRQDPAWPPTPRHLPPPPQWWLQSPPVPRNVPGSSSSRNTKKQPRERQSPRSWRAPRKRGASGEIKATVQRGRSCNIICVRAANPPEEHNVGNNAAGRKRRASLLIRALATPSLVPAARPPPRRAPSEMRTWTSRLCLLRERVGPHPSRRQQPLGGSSRQGAGAVPPTAGRGHGVHGPTAAGRVL